MRRRRGTRRSGRCRWRRGSGFSCTTTSTARTSVAFLRAAEEYGVVVERVPSDESGQVSVGGDGRRVGSRRRGVGVADPRPDERRAGEPGAPRSARWPGRPGCRSCSTRARRSDSSTSTSRRSVATSCRPRDASSCADRAGPASSTSVNRSSTGWPLATRPSRRRPRGRATATNSPRRAAVRVLGVRPRRVARPRCGGRARPGLGHRSHRGDGRRACSAAAGASRRRRIPPVRRGRSAVRHRHGGSAEPDGPTAEELAARLTEHRIHSSLAVASSARYDFERRDLPTLVRLSVHYTTTVGELDRTVEVLARRPDASWPLIYAAARWESARGTGPAINAASRRGASAGQHRRGRGDRPSGR